LDTGIVTAANSKILPVQNKNDIKESTAGEVRLFFIKLYWNEVLMYRLRKFYITLPAVIPWKLQAIKTYRLQDTLTSHVPFVARIFLIYQECQADVDRKLLNKCSSF